MKYTFRAKWHDDVQCVGLSLRVTDLVFIMDDNNKFPIDFHRLRDLQPELYREIYEYAREKLQKVQR